jgi:hypothetical protein
MMASLNLDKIKEASAMHTEFSQMVEKLPGSVAKTGISSPLFWYQQAQHVWQNEIRRRSQVIKA